jgi:hypothetical protein
VSALCFKDKEMIKKFIRKILPERLESEILNRKKIIHNFKILSVEYNQFNSMRKWSCEDKHGMPIPWYTYPAYEYLRQLDFSDKIVFEWSSGNSSLWWAEMARQVISIEHNKEWYDKIRKRKKLNQEILLHINKDDYVNAIRDGDTLHDVIIIDGIHRESCTRIAFNFLKPGGMIIFDNSDWHPVSCDYLRSLGLIQIDFFGFGPINKYTWATTLFIHRDFNIKAKSKIQPCYSIGGLCLNAETERSEND